MNAIDLIKKGYIPKELPPCFTTNTFCNNFISIFIELDNNHKALDALLNTIKKEKELSTDEMSEKLVRTKKKFANRLAYSDAVHFNIPKVGLSRVSIRIPNPFHQGKLSDIIAKNFNDIQHIFNGSLMSISKPIIELESGEGKRSVKHEHYAVFKEKSILESFSYSMQLKTDISKYYGSIYTHTIPYHGSHLGVRISTKKIWSCMIPILRR